MRQVFVFFLFVQTTAVSLFGAFPSYKIDTSLPVTELNAETQLTVLNARYGSRFTLTLNNRDKGVYTGALGYDLDEFTGLLIEVKTKQRNYCFNTCQAGNNMKYLKNQQLRAGIAGIQLSGSTDDGIDVIATIVSPFTVSNDLSDTNNIKVQIVPAFYILVDCKNNGKTDQEVTINIGLQKNNVHDMETNFAARSWMTGAKKNEMLFRDNSSINTKISLRTLDQPTTFFNHDGFNGLSILVPLKKQTGTTNRYLYATHSSEKVMTDKKYNLPLYFYYTRFWKNLNSVTNYCLENADMIIGKSQKIENLLIRSSRSPEEKWLTAITMRSDMANALFLIDPKGRERFLLSEGRFRHLSTIDVAYETELMAIFSPWRLKIQLETWLDYMARRQVNRGSNKYGEPHFEGMSASEFGPFLYHDVGDMPYMSETSDYWFGPHMAVEENCNFTLLLYWYWKLTGDEEYVKSALGMVDVLLYSVMNRDSDGNGIVDKGIGWSTYDNAEVIKKSPENVFLGVKQLTAYLAAADMFKNLAIESDGKGIHEDIKNVKDGTGVGFKTYQYNNTELRQRQKEKYTEAAGVIAETLTKAYEKYGYLPCSLDETFEGWNQKSVVLSEGLYLPALSGLKSDILDKLIPMFATSYSKALSESITSYGIKLSSGEGGTWFSKIMVADITAAYMLGIDKSHAIYTYQWNKNNFYAYNDGINADGKTSWIGFWYPRGVSVLGYLFKEKAFDASKKEEFIKELK